MRLFRAWAKQEVVVMKARKLGSQGLSVGEIGLGCMGLSVAYSGPTTEQQADRVIGRAIELGVSLFDTAEVYGDNEILVGKALKGAGQRVTIGTKFGFAIAKDGSGAPPGLNSKPAHIRDVCEASLRRLGVDTIDVFYQHRVDPLVPIEDVAGTVGDLIREGKVRFFGMCEASAATIQRAHKVQPISVIQSEYSLWSREIENEVLPICRELGIGIVAYSPLGRGFLAGVAKELPANDRRRSLPRWQAEALTNNLSLYERFSGLAAAKGCTPAQLALAWLLHKADDVVPIPGTTKVERLEENVAASAVALTAAEIAAMEALVPASSVAGERHDEVEATWADQNTGLHSH
jgi:aryl-alcohol dehydrogenase-like predicted oxidoreductase